MPQKKFSTRGILLLFTSKSQIVARKYSRTTVLFITGKDEGSACVSKVDSTEISLSREYDAAGLQGGGRSIQLTGSEKL